MLPHSRLFPALPFTAPLNAEHIRTALSTAGQRTLAHLVCHQQLDSTNTELLRQAAAGAPSATVCLAEYQTAGRGRRGRKWVSPFGNLYLSLLWRYSLPPAALGGMSLVVGVITAEVLQALGAQHLSLKWPNDLLWQKKKLAGLLLEVSAKSSTASTLIIGIGINVLTSTIENSTIDQPWTALNQVLTEQTVDRNLLAARLLDALFLALTDYEHTGLAPFLDRWRVFDQWQGQRVQLRCGEQQIIGIHAGIANDGALRLNTANGLQQFHAGEVSLRSITTDEYHRDILIKSTNDI
ncbi:biotin--[acetyl-CoA-carboxylase] ligase [Chromatium weissei]|nr:biotin--[acetyl-CoA-carboxylase] ligase [Chromatium weissei]